MKPREIEKRALALLEEALEVPEAERDAWVEARTTDNFALRARMKQLLAGSREADQIVTGGASTESVDTKPPERVGAYRIVETLGRGGMGAVYRAVRDSGDFDHVVAIKLIRPGALSSALVERFARERQILAGLSHPNIARLFDGGTTINGEPFIVMEYVAGRPLTEWADARSLGVRDRLKLFLDVCGAVGFAHQNLIIHRDITPPNVLVTEDGAVKLIDFGISRPPEDDAELAMTDKSLTGMSLTPSFAAPERIAGAGATTLSDIYSMGRLLQALLEGQPDDPDLAAIVAEATASDPADRYASADALADDIERFLDGRPVIARRGGRSYAVGKFIRRYRTGVGLATGALALIVAALVVALISFAGAEQARAAEARRFDQVRTLARYMLFDLTDALARTPGNTATRLALAEKSQTYLSALAAAPGASTGLKLETAQGLLRLARIQGVPPEPNFGDWAKAKANIALADRILSDVAAGGASVAGLAPDQARADLYRGLILALSDGDVKGGQAALKAAEVHLDGAPPPSRTAAWFEARDALRRAQAEVLFLAADDPGLARVAAQMDAEVGEWPRELREGRAGQEAHAWAAYYVGSSQSSLNSGDYGLPALQAAKRAMLALDARWPNDPATLYALVYTDYMMFASAARAEQQALSTGALEEARRRLSRLLELENADNALKTLDVNMENAYAQDLSNRGRHSEAIAVQRGAIAKVSAKIGPDRRLNAVADLGWGEMMLGLIARKAGDRALTCSSWVRARALFEEIERRGELNGFHAGFQPGLKANLELCARGAPLSAFKPLKE